MKKRSVIVVAVMAAVLVLSALVTAQEDATPFLGIGVDSDDNGALITAIQPDSPADLAGLETGDIITRLNGDTISADNLAEAIQALGVGDTVTLEVLREGDEVEIEAELAARPEQPDTEIRVFPFEERPYLGVSLDDGDNGVIIREVEADAPAAEAGLQVDDVLVSINGEAVEDVQAAIEMIRGLAVGDVVTLEVERGDERLTLEATLGSMTDIPAGAAVLDIVVYNQEAEAWQVFGLAAENPLAEAGLQSGDVITQIDGEVYNPETLAAYLDGLDGDTEVTLTVERDGELQDFSVPASALEALTMFNFGMPGRPGMPMMPEMMGGGARLGVTFEMVDEGAVITEVTADSPAADAGLQVDDIVTAVDGDVVDEERTLRDRLLAYEPDDTVTLDVVRGDETLSLDVTLENFPISDMMPFGNDRDLFDMLPRLFGPDQNGELPFDLERVPAQPTV